MRKKLTAKDYVVSAWSGGITSQIAISPAPARYADRAFLWRVSSASVELEESDFTALPDYRRLIAPLRGAMELRHNGGAAVVLEPYQVHGFSGGDITHSKGRCTDFNLMLRRDRADGSMEALRLPEGGENWSPDPKAEELLFCCAEGTVVVGTVKLQEGESLYLERDEVPALRLSGEGVVMVCQMWRL